MSWTHMSWANSPAGIAATLAALALLGGSMSARAEDPCAAFSWEVSYERALFSGAAKTLPSGQDDAHSPTLELDRLYELTLTPQAKITLPVAPGKKMLTDGAYAGIAHFAVQTAGAYRISLDQAFWLDVVSGGSLLRSRDFQGRQGCKAPHKIVEFVLPAGAPLTLQLSGTPSPSVRVTITRSPVPVPPPVPPPVPAT